MIIKKGNFRMLECIDRMIDIIDFHPWIANLCGIFISAGVAIYVMNKNHKDTDARDDKRKRDNDNIEIRKAQFRILDAVRTCQVYYITISVEYNENDILDHKYINNLRNVVSDINDSLKLNKEISIYDIEAYKEITETTSKMLDDIAVIQQLIDSKMVVKDKLILESLKRVNNKGFEYLDKNSVFKFNRDLKS
ncbi:hypothetical protein ETI09_03540 [Macrococcoides canis]|uniref:hypothetical protein n=1 Tax=Macrococcoides canis TaxID=1855823 RepID=UPI00105F274E|nr:hypothetical protein [Macrococcus canis]TDM43458.1 hypothetical protein ETI09_03540 [Macrococcus canis]